VDELSIEVVEGSGPGRCIALDGTLEIGRANGVGLVLEDELVSRRHARISLRDRGALVEDLGSLNGTFLNGDEIHDATEMRPGDQIIVGGAVLELRSAEQLRRRPTAVQPIPELLAQPPPLAIRPRKPDYVPADAARQDKAAHRLDPLLDVRTKAKARTAPIAVFVLVALVIMLFLATR
jgi:pSer/pThr/pTyr-binding forkhead associated (FHA) protein